MQHPEEGTIHSWLDGALPATEAAGVEAHIASCQTCAEAVAEARGFIAASSRILTALDDVPRGVLPAAPVRKRDLRVFWRAAAAMLVVAGGSLVVLREGGQDGRVTAISKQRTPASARTVSPPPPAEIGQPVAGSSSAAAEIDESAKASAPVPQDAGRNRTTIVRGRDLSANAERRRALEPLGAIGSGVSADAVAPSSVPAPAAANTRFAQAELPLKVLSVAQVSGARQTTYEIAPGQVVTLTERESSLLSAPLATAQSAAQPLVLRGGRAAQPSRTEAAPVSPPPPPAMDSRATADSATAGRAAGVAGPPVEQRKAALALADGAQSITWTEASTGKRLSLMGNVSVEQLQEIRRRIERERAGAGATIP